MASIFALSRWQGTPAIPYPFPNTLSPGNPPPDTLPTAGHPIPPSERTWDLKCAKCSSDSKNTTFNSNTMTTISDGSKRGVLLVHPLQPKIFSISCRSRFSENFAKSYVSAPSYGESWIRPRLVKLYPFECIKVKKLSLFDYRQKRQISISNISCDSVTVQKKA